MNYQDIIMKLSGSDIVDLIKDGKLHFDELTPPTQIDKFKSVSVEELNAIGYVQYLKENIGLLENCFNAESLSLPVLVQEVFDSLGIDILKKAVNYHHFPWVVQKVKKEHPDKKTAIKNLLNEIKESTKTFNRHNFFLIKNELPWELAKRLNNEEMNIDTLMLCISSKNIAALNTLIDEKYYRYESEIKWLLKHFPRRAEFSPETAMRIVKQKRSFFHQLPLENQLDEKILKYCFEHYVEDAVYASELSSQNLPLTEMPIHLLDHIKPDFTGVFVATRLLNVKPELITHPKVQVLINTPYFTKNFKNYLTHFTPEQKAILGIYEKGDVPEVMGNEMEFQSVDVLEKYIEQSILPDEIGRGFLFLMVKNKKAITQMSNVAADKVLMVFEKFIKDYEKSSAFRQNVPALVNFVLTYARNDFNKLKVLEDATNDKMVFYSVLADKLSSKELIQYIEHTKAKIGIAIF